MPSSVSSVGGGWRSRSRSRHAKSGWAAFSPLQLKDILVVVLMVYCFSCGSCCFLLWLVVLVLPFVVDVGPAMVGSMVSCGVVIAAVSTLVWIFSVAQCLVLTAICLFIVSWVMCLGFSAIGVATGQGMREQSVSRGVGFGPGGR